MFPEIIKLLITGILFLQGFAHGVAFYALTKDARSERPPSVPVRSWLLPSLAPKTAALIAIPFWLLSTVGFVTIALAFWQAEMPAEQWTQIAAGSAITSTLGIALFSGIWPGAPNRRLSTIDTVIALVINAALFVLLAVGWLPGTTFGG